MSEPGRCGQFRTNGRNLPSRPRVRIARCREANRRRSLRHVRAPSRCRWILSGEVFRSGRVKNSMSVVQIHLKPFVGERLFHDDVWCAISIDIESRKLEPAFCGRECDCVIAARRLVELDAECPLPIKKAGLNQDRAIRFLIVIKIGGRKSRRIPGQQCMGRFHAARQCSAQSILCLQSRDTE